MQDFSASAITTEYDPGVQTGRPSKHPRTAFGERLHAAREAAGLSQAQVAERIGVAQNAYAVWERHPVALKPQQIGELADILGVGVEEFFGRPSAKRRRGGPTGRLRQIFEEASTLSRSQQQKIVAILEPFVEQHGNGGS
jgi:transcriptional regulator with XRE-family HTH domain